MGGGAIRVMAEVTSGSVTMVTRNSCRLGTIHGRVRTHAMASAFSCKSVIIQLDRYCYIITSDAFRDPLFPDDFSVLRKDEAQATRVLTEAVGATLSMPELTVDTLDAPKMKVQFESWADTVTANAVFACRLVNLIREHVFCNVKGSSLSAKEESMWKRYHKFSSSSALRLLWQDGLNYLPEKRLFSLFVQAVTKCMMKAMIDVAVEGTKPAIVEEREVVLTSFEE